MNAPIGFLPPVNPLLEMAGLAEDAIYALYAAGHPLVLAFSGGRILVSSQRSP